MKTISSQQLHDETAQIIDELDGCEKFTIVKDGRVIGVILPVAGADQDHWAPVVHRGKPRSFSSLPRVEIPERSEDLLAAVRDER